ncbi:hypothetical protein K1Y72_20040 [Actinomadura sp. PM05-2]|uniref:BFD-like [2Fe-2S]-binding domain-containing protein n=1 Tax=Actinomadura parmotrematis TaxID=2864039 RepID=A0ABS7FW73_9ACTN|nr:hypothetical protein [Actinomadura parmotrematis]
MTEDDVRGCLAAGCGSAKEVKAACGMQPGCGSCTKRLYGLISEHRTASELVDALTGGPLPLEVVPADPAAPPAPAAPQTWPQPIAGEDATAAA